MGLGGMLQEKKRFNNHYLDINYVRMWLVHVVAPPKNDGYQIDTNKAYTILKWNIKVHLVVLVQVQTFKIERIKEIKCLEVCKTQGLTINFCNFHFTTTNKHHIANTNIPQIINGI
jgi:hypothetical protein